MGDINLEEAVVKFCNRYHICPDKSEKILLKLAIQDGIRLKILENIKELEEIIKNKEL